jgi:hypothetical protein
MITSKLSSSQKCKTDFRLGKKKKKKPVCDSLLKKIPEDNHMIFMLYAKKKRALGAAMIGARVRRCYVHTTVPNMQSQAFQRSF